MQYCVEGIIAQPEVWGTAELQCLCIKDLKDRSGLFGGGIIGIAALIAEQLGPLQHFPDKILGIQQFHGHHLMEPTGNTVELIVEESAEQSLELGHDELHCVFVVLDGKADFRLGYVQAIGTDFSVEPKMACGTFAPIVGIGKPQHR